MKDETPSQYPKQVPMAVPIKVPSRCGVKALLRAEVPLNSASPRAMVSFQPTSAAHLPRLR